MNGARCTSGHHSERACQPWTLTGLIHPRVVAVTAKALESERTAVLVLGPPRSGTSAASHILSKLGVEFGTRDDFVDSDVHTHNPVFFELRKLNELNDRILAHLGIQYADFDYFHDPSVVEPEIVKRFAADIGLLVEKELSNGRLIGLKDPRFVFTLAVWKEALEGLGYKLKFLLTTRSTEAVVKSNVEVNGFSDGHNRRIAVLSERLAAVQLRGKDVLIVNYDRLIDQPVTESKRIASWLGQADADIRGVAQVIANDLRHHVPEGQLPDRPGATSGDLDANAKAFTLWRTALEDIGIVELLDRRRKSVVDLERELLAANEQKWLEGTRFNEKVDQLKGRVHSLEQELLIANTQKANEAAEWSRREQDLRQKLQESVTSAVEQLRRADFAEQKNIELQATLSAIEARLHDRGLELQRLETSAVEQLRRADSADQKNIELQVKLSKAEARLHETGLDLQKMAASAVEQLHRADDADRKCVSLDSALGQARTELEAAERERAGLVTQLDEANSRGQAAEALVSAMRTDIAALTLHLDRLTSDREALAAHVERLSLRTRGLERRQRWAAIAGTLAAIAATAAYLMWL